MMKEKKISKVIPFPNLKKRLIDKGMAALKEKNFQEALELFIEAQEIDRENEAEIQFGIALCLMELGQLEEAKKTCKKMLLEDTGDYFTVLQVYLTILIQLHQYKEVQETIEAVLEENQLPAQNAEQFYKLLEFSRKMNETGEVDLDDTVESNIDFGSEHDQMLFIQSLKNQNVIKYIQQLKMILEDPNTNPIIKTLALQLLMDSEIEKEVTVHKFGKTLDVKPSALFDPNELAFTKKVINILDDTLGNENPVLFETVKELWLRHLYVLFPFTPEPAEEKLWAAALHLVGYEMHGITLEREEMEAMYGVSLEQIEHLCVNIYHLEEISYMQI
ncbi:tetratricopeptide repeat protein [Metabacillus fastidiosus]|uniref:tetratricopeptide repeat protein n=1 Tax=Metabacillus fastidiosus TaxID=1458 RepID=UPI002E1EB1BF|nr:tetratricopeptide repeat protein [Metabacillus fastidiosus]